MTMWQRRLLSSTRARAMAALRQRLYYSSSPPAAANKKIQVWYASQGGTAQFFAQQFAEAMQEELPVDVTVKGLQDKSYLKPKNPDDLHFFLVSCAGVGEVPDNGRQFWDWIMQQEASSSGNWSSLNYAVFGLGNQKAHPNHYNVIGKKLDAQLLALGAHQFQPLGLGDDGDCLDDDFDQWMEDTIDRMRKQTETQGAVTSITSDDDRASLDSPAEANDDDVSSSLVTSNTDHPRISCPGISKLSDGTRRISIKKYPTLVLEPAVNDLVRPDLFFLEGDNSFYATSTSQLKVKNNERLALHAGESGMHELSIELTTNAHEYTTGDHLMVYPKNSDALVQAYVNLLDVDPHAIILGCEDDAKYPFPTGLTVMETLTHCVDLGATPSPSCARMILGLDRTADLDYKQDIAVPRRTILDLVLEQRRLGIDCNLSLEDLLHQATPMKPRYYSIASSNIQYPKEIHLCYRPVKYVTTHGYLREGVCTSYLMHKGVLPQNSGRRIDEEAESIPASIAPHPRFRLPSSPETPVMMIGGGCGVAPIRAFLQERVYLASSSSQTKFGPGILYMGYRNPQDEVYKELVQEALDTGALTTAKTVYSSGCSLPNQKCSSASQLVRREGAAVWEHMESGGYIYICGGAYAFGATVKAELLDLVQEHGKMTFEESEDYLRSLSDQGRFLADLAD